MPKAVRFAELDGVDVLTVAEVERPVLGERQVLVNVVAAGINPGEAVIRRGFLHDWFPATFLSSQGSDLAGIVEELGAEITGFTVGDVVIGVTHHRQARRVRARKGWAPRSQPRGYPVGAGRCTLRCRYHRAPGGARRWDPAR